MPSIPYRSRARSSRAGIILRDQRVQSLVTALRDRGEEDWNDLANRMERCTAAAKARAAWRSEAGLSPQRKDGFECRTIACPACRGRVVWGSQRLAYQRLLDADVIDCSLVTVVLARAGSVERVLDEVPRWRATLKRFRRRQALHDPAWRDLVLSGFVEIDAVHIEDLQQLGSVRRCLVPSLPLLSALEEEGVVWVPCMHVAIHHPGLSRDDLSDALQCQWPVHRQVDVRPALLRGTGAEEAGHIVGYSLKFDQTTRLAETDQPWPAAWSAHLFGSLHARRDGLRPLRITLGPMQSHQPVDPQQRPDHPSIVAVPETPKATV